MISPLAAALLDPPNASEVLCDTPAGVTLPDEDVDETFHGVGQDACDFVYATSFVTWSEDGSTATISIYLRSGFYRTQTPFGGTPFLINPNAYLNQSAGGAATLANPLRWLGVEPGFPIYKLEVWAGGRYAATVDASVLGTTARAVLTGLNSDVDALILHLGDEGTGSPTVVTIPINVRVPEDAPHFFIEEADVYRIDIPRADTALDAYGGVTYRAPYQAPRFEQDHRYEEHLFDFSGRFGSFNKPRWSGSGTYYSDSAATYSFSFEVRVPLSVRVGVLWDEIRGVIRNQCYANAMMSGCSAGGANAVWTMNVYDESTHATVYNEAIRRSENYYVEYCQDVQHVPVCFANEDEQHFRGEAVSHEVAVPAQPGRTYTVSTTAHTGTCCPIIGSDYSRYSDVGGLGSLYFKSNFRKAWLEV